MAVLNNYGSLVISGTLNQTSRWSQHNFPSGSITTSSPSAVASFNDYAAIEGPVSFTQGTIHLYTYDSSVHANVPRSSYQNLAIDVAQWSLVQNLTVTGTLSIGSGWDPAHRWTTLNANGYTLNIGAITLSGFANNGNAALVKANAPIYGNPCTTTNDCYSTYTCNQSTGRCQ